MFHLSLADVSWVKLNSWQWGGEITARILFYVWGQDFSWPALIPWLSAPRCCWWVMTKVEGETGFSWVTGPRKHCQPVGFNRTAASQAGRTEVMQRNKPLTHSTWQTMCSNTNHLSNSFIQQHQRWWITGFSGSSQAWVKHISYRVYSSSYFSFFSTLSGWTCKSSWKINPAVIKCSQSSLLDSWDWCEDGEMKLLLANKNTAEPLSERLCSYAE